MALLTMETVLSTENVNFKDLIQYPDIRIFKGRVTFICGASGSGKSSLLKLFNAVETPKRGIVRYNGEDVSCMNTVVLRQNVSLAGQSVYLFDKTIEENFQEYCSYREVPPLSQEEMKRFLRLCCADFPLSANCRSLSGGERQRVYLAVFLSFCPKVLMLDEPTSALDQATGIEVMEHLCRFSKEHDMTLVVVSHDMELADRFAEERILLGGIEK